MRLLSSGRDRKALKLLCHLCPLAEAGPADPPSPRFLRSPTPRFADFFPEVRREF